MIRSVLAIGLLIGACHALAQAQTEEKQEESSPAWPPPGLVTPASGGKLELGSELVMSDAAGYRDLESVPKHILAECGDLGRVLADATEGAGIDAGLKIVKKAAVDPSNGSQVLVLSIIAISSQRQARLGFIPTPRVSMSVRAELYRDRVLVSANGMNRLSSGGPVGEVRAACSVLETTAKTLGSDIARWLKSIARETPGEVAR